MVIVALGTPITSLAIHFFIPPPLGTQETHLVSLFFKLICLAQKREKGLISKRPSYNYNGFILCRPDYNLLPVCPS